MNRNHSLERIPLLVLALAALLAVASACKSTVPAKVQIKDAEVTSKIKAKLAASGEVNPFNIDVDTNEGEVTLQGRVAKESAKVEAERLARDTEGVRRVINLIKVGDHTQ
jgi:hyperosmotically inducible periplasmic protein